MNAAKSKEPSSRPVRLIEKEELGDFRRWELPVMEGAKKAAKKKGKQPEPPPEQEPAAPPITEEELAAIRQQVHREGFEQGRQEGIKSGQGEVQSRAQRLQQVLHGLARPLEDLDEQVEEELVALAVAMARQLVRREFQVNPDHVVGVVREALAALPSSASKVKVHLHPEDAALVREVLQVADEEERPWKVVDDPVLTRGGCRVVSDRSQVDATLEARLNAVVAQTLGVERSSDRDEE